MIKIYKKHYHLEKNLRSIIYDQILKRKLLIFSSIILFIGLLILFRVYKNINKVEAGWWNDTWQYRKKITLTSGSSAVSNYQVKVEADTSTLITNGKLRSDCGDIRFTSAAGVELPYWVEESGSNTCNDTDTNIWVKVDQIPASGGNFIYMYYSNPSANKGASGDNTFNFFDDFSASSLNTTKWSSTLNTPTVSSGVLVLDGTSSSARDIALSNYIVGPGMITTIRHQSSVAAKISRFGISSAINDYWQGGADAAVIQKYSDNNLYTDTILANTATQNSREAYDTSYHIYQVKYVSLSSVIFYADANNWTHTTNIPTATSLKVWLQGETGTANVDWIFVRSYLATEPAASVGSEEQGTGPVAYYSFDEGQGTTIHNQQEKNGENGLISWWKFDDASSGTSPAPVDTMGRNNGTWVGNAAYSSTARIGNAATFDGTGDYISAGTNINLSGSSFTLSAWAKRGATGVRHYIMGLGDTGSTNTSLHFGFTDTNVFRCGFYSDDLDTTTTYTDSNWHQWACTYDSGSNTRKIYQDGVLVAQGTATGDFSGSGTFYIGRIGWSDTYHFNGQIDEAKAYNRALSASEIGADYTSTRGHMMNMSPALDWVDGASQNPNQKPLGKALDFDGSNDYVDVLESSSLKPTSSISYGAWVKYSYTAGTYHVINKSKSLWVSYLLSANQNAFSCTIGYDSGVNVYSVTSSSIVGDNNWHHVYCTYDKSNLKIYIDGKFNNSTGGSADIYYDSSGYPLRIGNHIANDAPFLGQIDEVKIYKYALSADQVKKDYNRGVTAVLGAGQDASRGTPPVGWWKMDEGSAYSAFDSSGNGNAGIMTNMDALTDWVAGKVGKALDFDGSDDYVQVADASTLDFTTNLTVSAWVKRNGTGVYDRIIAKDHSGTGASWYFQIGSTNILQFGATTDGSSANQRYCNSTGTINTNWHFVTAIYDGTYISFYIDGVLDKTSTLGSTGCASGTIFSGSLINSDQPLWIGRLDWSGTSYYYTGQIDHVKLYNYARTTDQIHYDMATGSPIAYYSFDEGYGTTVHNQQEKNGENGLISWWKFDDASSGTSPVPQDTMGINNGSWNGNATYTSTAKIGNAATFDGTGDYINIGDTPTVDFGSGNFTLSAWVKRAATGSTHIIIGKDLDTSGNRQFFLAIMDTNVVRISYMKATDSQIYLDTTSTITDTNWHYVVGQRSGDSFNIYIDGALSTSGTTSGTHGTMQSTTAQLQIGRREYSTYLNEFNGQIDEVKIYNRDLSASEVAADYNSVHGNMINMSASSDWVDGARQNPNQKPLGKALDFDGTDDFVFVPDQNSLDLTTSFTISAWIYQKSTQTTGYRIVDKETAGGADGYNFDTRADTGGRTLRLCTNGCVTANTAYALNTWHHVAVIHAGGNTTFYLDGKSDGSSAQNDASANSLNMYIGKPNGTPGSPAEYFNGQIDEVKIYNYALTASEILVDYNRGAALVLGAGKSESDPGSGNLIGWWKLDEGSGYTAFDSSGKNQTANFFTGWTSMDNSNWVQGQIGKGVEFDGTYGECLRASASAMITLNRSFSVSAWIKNDTLSGTDDIISATRGYSVNGFAFGTNGTGLRFTTFNVKDYDTTTVSLLTNRWYYVTAVMDSADDVSFYVDGVFKEKVTHNAPGLLNPDDDYLIGATYTGVAVADLFDGKIDNLKVWSKELTPAEVAWDYNQGAPIYHWAFNQSDGVIATNEQGKSVTTDGLVGFWTMDTSGTINDMSGNGNTLTGTGSATLVTGIKNNAISFPNGNKHQYYCNDADCGEDLDYQGNGLTVSTWVKATNVADASWKNIVIKHNYYSSTDNGGYTISTYTDGTTYFLVRNSNGTTVQCSVNSGVVVSTTTWQHIVGTYDGSTCKIYVDGVLKTTTAYTGGIKNVIEGFAIGGSDGGNYTFNGLIDHTKVWQRALSAEEIKIEAQYDEKYGYLTNMDASTDWVAGAWPNPNRPKLGNALDFDGTDDYVTAGDVLDMGTGDLSISTWIKTDGAIVNKSIVSKASATPYYSVWLDGSGKADAVFHNGSSSVASASTTSVNDGAWHHIVAVWDRDGNQYIYVDGKREDYDSISSDSATDISNANPLTIGTNCNFAYSCGNYFDGQIDEVKIFNYALSANQVKLDYNNSSAVRF